MVDFDVHVEFTKPNLSFAVRFQLEDRGGLVEPGKIQLLGFFFGGHVFWHLSEHDECVQRRHCEAQCWLVVVAFERDIIRHFGVVPLIVLQLKDDFVENTFAELVDDAQKVSVFVDTTTLRQFHSGGFIRL